MAAELGAFIPGFGEFSPFGGICPIPVEFGGICPIDEGGLENTPLSLFVALVGGPRCEPMLGKD